MEETKEYLGKKTLVLQMESFRETYANQNNRGTAWPIIFEVQEFQLLGVAHEEYSYGNHCVKVKQFMHPELESSTFDTREDLEKYLITYRGEDMLDRYSAQHIKEIYMLYRWNTVTWCLTQAGAEDFLARDRHNMGRTRIYVTHLSHRNVEMRKLFNLLELKSNG